MGNNKELTPEGILSEFHFQPHTAELTHRRTQPNEDLILERNHELRKQPEAFVKNDYFHQIASIPLIMWDKAIREGYELNAPDNKVADKELMRFLRSESGKMCLVRDKI